MRLHPQSFIIQANALYLVNRKRLNMYRCLADEIQIRRTHDGDKLVAKRTRKRKPNWAMHATVPCARVDVLLCYVNRDGSHDDTLSAGNAPRPLIAAGVPVG